MLNLGMDADELRRRQEAGEAAALRGASWAESARATGSGAEAALADLLFGIYCELTVIVDTLTTRPSAGDSSPAESDRR